VLVSSTVKDLVVGSSLAFDDRGVHQLRGIPGEWRLYALKSGSTERPLRTPQSVLADRVRSSQ
jgi:hypothetical protein